MMATARARRWTEWEVPDEDVLIGWRCECGRIVTDEQLEREYHHCPRCYTWSPRREEIALVRDGTEMIEVIVLEDGDDTL